MPVTPENRTALQKFQNAVAQWPQARWWRLLAGIISLLASALLLWFLFNVAELIESILGRTKDLDGSDFERSVLSWAVILALRATLGMLSGLFGMYEIISTLRYWQGRPAHLALSVIIEKEFGIVGTTSALPKNETQPSLSSGELRFRALVGALIAGGAGVYLVWVLDELDVRRTLLLLAAVLAGSCYYLWNRYVMSFYAQPGPEHDLTTHLNGPA